MNSLVKEIIKNFLPEEEKKQTTALYAGGFKPPTAGHFDVIKEALRQNPEIEEFIIFVGSKERDGVSQDESLLIWEIYNKYLPFKVKIEPSSVPPVKAVYEFSKNHPTREILWILGAREDNEQDFTDISSRTKSITNYPNIEARTIITKGGVSGTAARNASKVSFEKFEPFLPSVLTPEEKQEVYQIVSGKIQENDPKVGTGKKPKGSGRRLYTDEDPTDTVSVKFSTKQDIIDTFNKTSFKSKSHARQSQIINLVHQRVRAAYDRAKDPDVKKRLKIALDYAEQRKEASKKKTQHLKDQKENIDPKAQAKYKGKAAPYGSGYNKVQENAQSLKYTTPKFEEEWKEARRYPEFKRLGKDKWVELAKTGKPVKITSAEDINNTDAHTPSLFKTLNPEKQERALAQLEAGNVEMPIVALYSDGYKELLAGNTRLTAMMGKNGEATVWQFNVPDEINENASYSNHIDYKQKIKALTQHMLDKGMNIVPLPKVIFKHGDEENAKQFLGKTAYYNPETMEIVLYTEGRHPKDIVRSFSHEMIHHIQNLEGRLGNVATTNTLEDDHLDKIEQEANLNGTMTFRNWTDSLNEAIVGNKVVCDGCGWSWNIEDGGKDVYLCHKCGHDNTPLQEKKSKDPFGLNAYAMELARLREEETEYTIYCDMDSVLVDFDRGYQELTGMTSQQADANGVEAFWEPLTKAGAKFWITLQWMPDGKQLWNYIKKYNPILLSAPSREESSKLGKRVWVKRELPGVKLILKYASQKQEYASPTSILIDDRQKNIDQWEAAGGIGILHTNTANTIKQLQQLGL
jgi:hypothetical protein